MKSPDITQLFVTDKTISTLRNKGHFFWQTSESKGLYIQHARDEIKVYARQVTKLNRVKVDERSVESFRNESLRHLR